MKPFAVVQNSVQNFIGIGPAGRLASLKSKRPELEGRIENLISRNEAIADTDDFAAIAAGEAALATARREMELLDAALETARKAAAEAEAAEAERLLQERYGRMRKELGAFATSIKADLGAIVKKISSFESLADGLPRNERFVFWIPTLVEEMNKELRVKLPPVAGNDLSAYAARVSQTRRITLDLDVAITKVD